MATPKLTYFDVRARGEITRLTFAAAKKPFEDVRIEFQDWPALKPKTPMGGLPILEVGGKTYCQGLAIATYVARENGLYGKNNLDGLMIDQIQQIREDFLTAQAKAHFAKSDEEKAELTKKLMEETVPQVVGFFNKVIKENKSGFAVGSSLTLADIVIFEGTENLVKADPKCLDKYPEVKALREKVAATPGIKEYLAKRKDTAM